MGRRKLDYAKPEYKFRPVPKAERQKIQHLIDLVARQAKVGRRVRMEVENTRNTNGISLRWEPATQSVKVSRYVSLSWCQDNGYRGW
jgi:hypothetical protein